MITIPPDTFAEFLRQTVPQWPDLPMLTYTRLRGTPDTSMLFASMGAETANKVAQQALDEGKTIEVFVDPAMDAEEIADPPLSYRLV